MDFIEGLHMYNGKEKKIVVIERLTKYAHFIRMKKSYSTKEIVEIFCNNIYKLHGFPKVIVSDRDAKFKGKFWMDFFKHIGTYFNISFTYHPQTYSQTKIVNTWLEAYLHFYAADKQSKWT